jgi:hypothetical protein
LVRLASGSWSGAPAEPGIRGPVVSSENVTQVLAASFAAMGLGVGMLTLYGRLRWRNRALREILQRAGGGADAQMASMCRITRIAKRRVTDSRSSSGLAGHVVVIPSRWRPLRMTMWRAGLFLIGLTIEASPDTCVGGAREPVAT